MGSISSVGDEGGDRVVVAAGEPGQGHGHGFADNGDAELGEPGWHGGEECARGGQCFGDDFNDQAPGPGRVVGRPRDDQGERRCRVLFASGSASRTPHATCSVRRRPGG